MYGLPATQLIRRVIWKSNFHQLLYPMTIFIKRRYLKIETILLRIESFNCISIVSKNQLKDFSMYSCFIHCHFAFIMFLSVYFPRNVCNANCVILIIEQDARRSIQGDTEIGFSYRKEKESYCFFFFIFIFLFVFLVVPFWCFGKRFD